MSVKVAFYKGREAFLDKLVQWWTNSPYSHCEIVVDEISYSSSPRDGGVRPRGIIFNPEHWDFLTLTQADAQSIVAWFQAHRGAKYDWLGLLGFVLPHPINSPDRWFCSEACAAALGLALPWTLTPQDLYFLLSEKEPTPAQSVPAV